MNFFSRKDRNSEHVELPRMTLPEVEPPPYPERGPRTSAYAPPPLRRDPEIESLMVSANTVMELRERIRALEYDLAAEKTEVATWRARAQAKDELHVVLIHDLTRYKSFYDAFTARFRDVSIILMDVMQSAREAEANFASSETIRSGSQDTPLISDNDLMPEVDSQPATPETKP